MKIVIVARRKPAANIFDNGPKVSLKFVSADKIDPNPKNKYGAMLGYEVPSDWSWNRRSSHMDRTFEFTSEWDEEFGTPGALLVQNCSKGHEFFLETITLEDVPPRGGHERGPIHFICNSWVYQEQGKRIFFANKAYLPHETPKALVNCREEDLKALRGNGEGELKEHDRVYDYAVYNDLGDPADGLKLERNILGGSPDYPYPRRGRTSRPPSTLNPKYESRKGFKASNTNVYVPRDEQFDPRKKNDFTGDGIKSVLQDILHSEVLYDSNRDEFESFEELDNLYHKDQPFSLLNPSGFWTAISRRENYPMPQVIKADPKAWRTDEEFAREMLAGVNPLIIRLLQEFPPKSNLDPRSYGHQHSSITKEHIENNLDGLTVEVALKSSRLFILDHHDSVIPYLRKINEDPDSVTKTYASRTLLFLSDDETLKPVAIELSLPHEEGDKFGVVSKVYTPAQSGVEGAIWQLARAYVSVADSGHHQLISHWLNTHATMEPFVIATHRQLSAVHPIHKLLHPHFRDTMSINALAREKLVSAGGVIETSFYPGKYSMEISSVIYKSWNFLEQSLPKDLKKRGIAVGDINSPDDLDKLLIKDYPYAVDGLKIWFAIKDWVRDYCSFYYKTDQTVREDSELQAWWKELREVGHGDKKHEPWWPKMQTRAELIESCTIIIWIASALHSAVNFGQYDYAGYAPNRPTGSRRFMPEKGTPEYAELEKDPESGKTFLKTITPQKLCLPVMTVVEILSQQSTDEVYLGQREANWTSEKEVISIFEAFHDKLSRIEEQIIDMNRDKKWKNRAGPVDMPYTLLVPTPLVDKNGNKDRQYGKGIPNSVSI